MASARIMEMSITWSDKRWDVVNTTSLDGLLIGRKIMTMTFFFFNHWEKKESKLLVATLHGTNGKS